MKDAEARVKKAQALLDLRKDLILKLAAVDDELDTVLAGGKTLAQKMGLLRTAFGEMWKAKHRKDYAWTSAVAGQEGGLLKTLAQQVSVEDAIERMSRYFLDADDYLQQQRYPLRLFVWRVNQYVDGDDLDFEADQPPSDCRHTPRCKTDAQHTDVRMREMRA